MLMMRRGKAREGKGSVWCGAYGKGSQHEAETPHFDRYSEALSLTTTIAGAEAETEPSPKCHVPSPIMLFWIGTRPEQLTERLPF